MTGWEERGCTRSEGAEQHCFSSSQGHRSQVADLVNSSPPPNHLDWFLNPLKETLLKPVIKSLVTVFVQYNKGLENKLTRAPLLGLAKSIHNIIANL